MRLLAPFLFFPFDLIKTLFQKKKKKNHNRHLIANPVRILWPCRWQSWKKLIRGFLTPAPGPQASHPRRGLQWLEAVVHPQHPHSPSPVPIL